MIFFSFFDTTTEGYRGTRNSGSFFLFKLFATPYKNVTVNLHIFPPLGHSIKAYTTLEMQLGGAFFCCKSLYGFIIFPSPSFLRLMWNTNCRQYCHQLMNTGVDRS